MKQNKIVEKYFKNSNKEHEFWESDYTRKYTVEAINALLEHVYENNDYYRQKIDDNNIDLLEGVSLKDFQKLGFLKKEDLQENLFLVLSVPREQISQIFLSTGTTNSKTIYMMHTLNDLYNLDLAPDIKRILPIEKNDLVVNALPYEMSSAGLCLHRVLQNGKQAGVISTGKGGFYSKPEKTIEAIIAMRVSAMITTPSYAMQLAEAAEKMKVNLKEVCVIKNIWLTGEGCSDAFRNRVEEIWGCSAFRYYGSLECGVLGIECIEKDGYHIPEGHVYIEIIDPETKKLLSAGEVGEIVVTTLLREGSPLIRYETQDLGYIEDVECECGTKLKKLFLRGRRMDQIRVEGKEYSPLYIEEFLMRNQEVGNNYRFVIHNDYLLIETTLRSGFEKEDIIEIEKSLASKIEFGSGVPVKVKIIDQLPYDGGKVRRVQTSNMGEGKK